FVNRAMRPLELDDDRQAILVALGSLNVADRSRARVVRIPNTLHLEEIQVSESLLPELIGQQGVEVVDLPHPLEFDEIGRLRQI
ncbi:MAG: hypothetical protein M1598_08005, partial [Actinobacteria bacterium]|nr:hypothetical protein [Actinomycetota bacterium]